MKAKYILPALFGILSLTAVSCVDDHDEPDTKDYVITSKTDIGTTNSTIAKVKTDYESVTSSTNNFVKVDSNLIIEGVVCANDISGNLYQTVLLRDINKDGTDQCLLLGIKNTCLYPYFVLGQRLKINLKGLYIGCYSKVPKVGQPYYTSSGNLRLGPMLLELCATHIQLLGDPNPAAPELTPRDLTGAEGLAWLKSSKNKTYQNVPMLATVEGTIQEMQGTQAETAEKGSVVNEYEPLPKIFGPEALRDNGYGVDRTLMINGSTTTMTLRTSTDNIISYLPLPTDSRKYTGMLTYYSSWQIQLRDTTDINPIIHVDPYTGK